MDGYATFTRVEQVRLRRASDRDRDAWQFAPAPDDEAIDLETVPLDLLIGERIERMRELWRQTTFFLFDGEGWR